MPNNPVTLKAAFAQVQTLYTSVASGSGSVNPNCFSNGCSEIVGSQITVTATPAPGGVWQFASWTITGASCTNGISNNPCSFSMPNNPVTLKVTFITGSLKLLSATIDGSSNTYVGQIDKSLGYAQFTVSITVQNTGMNDLPTPQSLVPPSGIVPTLCPNSPPQGQGVTSSCWKIVQGVYPLTDAGGNPLSSKIQCSLSSGSSNTIPKQTTVTLSYSCKMNSWTYAVCTNFGQAVNFITEVGGEAASAGGDQAAAAAIGKYVPVASSAALGLQVLEHFGPAVYVFMTTGSQGEAFVYLINQGVITVGVVYTLEFSLAQFTSSNVVIDYSALTNPIDVVIFAPQDKVDAALDYVGVELFQDGIDASGIIIGDPTWAAVPIATSGFTAQSENYLLNELAGPNSACVAPPQPQNGFDFSLSSSGGITVSQGKSGQNTITVKLTSSSPYTSHSIPSSQLVGLSCSGLPLGAQFTFATASSYPTFSTTLTISTSTLTPVGSYSITVLGSGGGISHTTSFTLTVNPYPGGSVSGSSKVTATSTSDSNNPFVAPTRRFAKPLRISATSSHA
jgi:hypothetical protein